MFMMAVLRARCVALGLQADCRRRVWLFDSFRGLPPPGHTADDYDYGQLNYFLAVPLDSVVASFHHRHFTASAVATPAHDCAVLSDTGATELRRKGNAVFVRGFFNESMPWLMQELTTEGSQLSACVGAETGAFDRIALLRLDGDMYTSTMDVLFELGPLVQVGGIVYNDDYMLPGQPLAMNQFRLLVGWERPLILHGDGFSAYFEVDRIACVTPAMTRWRAAGYPLHKFAYVLEHSGRGACDS